MPTILSGWFLPFYFTCFGACRNSILLSSSRKCFVDHASSPDFPSSWGWVERWLYFNFLVNCPFRRLLCTHNTYMHFMEAWAFPAVVAARGQCGEPEVHNEWRAAERYGVFFWRTDGANLEPSNWRDCHQIPCIPLWPYTAPIYGEEYPNKAINDPWVLL